MIPTTTQSSAMNRYVIGEKLGEGGMGAVFKAKDRLSGDVIALKRVSIPVAQLDFNSKTDSDDLRLALTQEFRTLASLRHPNIISVLDYGFDSSGQPFFTMQLLEDGKTFKEANEGQNNDTKFDLVIQMLQALSYLHRRGLVHRDLKPANVMVVENQVKVVDFGLAITFEQAEDTVETVGTVAYMAPEVLQGNTAKAASDLYAVGMMAFEAFSGEYPFDLSEGVYATIRNVMYTMPDASSLQIPPLAIDVLHKLLAKDSRERYFNAQEVINAFRKATGQSLGEETIEIRESYLQAARFVGRDVELARLTMWLEDTVAGNGKSVLIGGESGVGKSRLIDELQTSALVQGALVLRGQAITQGGTPYLIWRDVMRRLVLQAELKDEEASVLKQLVPDIGTLLGKDIPDAPPLDSAGTQFRLMTTIKAVLQRHEQPMLLILEDLHWVDSASLKLLGEINKIVEQAKVFVVASYRDDEYPSLPEVVPSMEHMLLKRFDYDSIMDLSTSMLGNVALRPQVVDLLHRETEGNAFFLVEIVRALAEEAGSLDLIGEATLPAKVFAGGIQQIIQRRLDKIAASSQPLLAFAAASGRQLDLGLLRYVIDNQGLDQLPANLDEWLNEGQEAAIFEVRDEQWRFTHDKLREALLDEMNEEFRQELHKTIAEAIETVYPEDDTKAAALVHQWHMAGNPHKEFEYAVKAGGLAISNTANEEAIQFFNRALALIDNVLEMPHRLIQEVGIQIRRGIALMNARGYASPATAQAYERAREIALMLGESPQLAPVYCGLWAYYIVSGNHKKGVAVARELVEMGESLNDDLVKMIGYWCLGGCQFLIGEFEESVEHCQRAIDLYDFDQHNKLCFMYGTDPAMSAGLWQSLSYWCLGYPDKAIKANNEANELGERVGQPFGMAGARNLAAWLYSLVNDIEKMQIEAAKCVEISDKYGFPVWGSTGRLRLVVASIRSGELKPEYTNHFRVSEQVYKRTGAIMVVPHWKALQGDLYCRLGNADTAMQHIEEAHEIASTTGEYWYHSAIYIHQAEIEVANGNEFAAEQSLQKALEIARNQNAKSYELRAALALGEIWRDQGQSEEALELVKPIYEWFNEGHDTPDLVAAKAFVESF